ncbi:MAG: hypothetical protein V4525_05145 [Pseudomonadota bacterium]
MVISHQQHLKQVIRHSAKRIFRRSSAWWLARQARERRILKMGMWIILAASFYTVAEGMWGFYSRLPQTRVQWLQREWLLEDIHWLMKSKASATAPTSPSAPVSSLLPASGAFLMLAHQPGVNGQCASQSAGQWLCTGESASLEAVQQWWAKGRNEGYFVEKFDAKTHAPGLIKWTLVVHR